jgi:GNAT superfamily N-acetyltransferase
MTGVITKSQRLVPLGLQALESKDLTAVAAMAARCSRETIYHRFHGFIDLPTYLASLLTTDQTTIVAWSKGCCVGFASLAGGPQGHEVGVLVEDRWQRQGVGSALLEGLVDVARQRQLLLLHADVLHEDAFSLRLLGRHGRLEVGLDYGCYSVVVHLEETPTPTDPCNGRAMSQWPSYGAMFGPTKPTAGPDRDADPTSRDAPGAGEQGCPFSDLRPSAYPPNAEIGTTSALGWGGPSASTQRTSM